MMPMFLTVHLGSNDQRVTEVPVVPEMLCRDVVELCREPGEADCYLAETWRGSERVVEEDEPILEVLQRWGQQRGEVRYILRYQRASGHETAGCRAADQTTLERLRENGFSVIPLDMSLSELQDLATRQQQQIDAQQQLLAFKEQQLCHLKLQEQHQEASGQDRLLQLQENIRNQEAKLLRVRALRGQVEQKRNINSKLVEEIGQMTSLFQRKHNELELAAAKVEELSDQLEAMRNSRFEPPFPFHPHNSSSGLTDLYKDLQLRNKLNQEQSARLQQQKDRLKKNNLEVVAMDQRLGELQERLWKKKAALQQKENLPVALNSVNPQHEPSSRVAAVGPYIQSASRSSSQPSAVLPCQETMVKSAYPDGTATLPMPSSSRKPPAIPAKPSISVETLKDNAYFPSHGASRLGHTAQAQPKDNQSFGNGLSKSTVPPAVPTKPKLFPFSGPPTFSKPAFWTGTFPGKKKLKDPGVMSIHSNTLPLHSNKESPPAAAVRPYTPNPTDVPPPVFQKPQTLAASSIYSMYTQQATPGKAYQAEGQGTLSRSKPRVFGKPVLPAGKRPQTVSSESTSLRSGLCEFETETISTAINDDKGPDGDTAECVTPRPLSPSKLLPFASNPHRNSDADLEGLRRRLHNAPRPLKKRSSVVEPEGPAGFNIEKLLYQKTTLAAMETIPMKNISRPEENVQSTVPDDRTIKKDVSSRVKDKSLAVLMSAGHNSDSLTTPSLPFPDPRYYPFLLSPQEDKDEDLSSSATQQEHFPEEIFTWPPPPYPSCEEEEQADDTFNFQQPIPQNTDLPSKQSILRKPGSDRLEHRTSVQFSPLALLLDSSLEGEFDLVQRVIYDVDDASMPNDEGITALHNAVCAGHTDIVKFLVQFGVNVNAADSDGWTPLHCAASCNNVQVCKFLVESGAAVFAATYSDMQTAADKCEEMEEGYAQCSQFLYGVQEKMGVMNRGVVYALWSYTPENKDELGFTEGDCLTVLKQEGEVETEWWWARCGDHEGYIPRNLLGLYPRIKPRQRSLA
ncbi:apoptosis-stimulating of p53 protein 2-like isoform X2 [Xiphophorus couchianus]|uniref:apoptosis-stimulating of p53 protein 2-like isoform X2 n=1 Tax=Xiphophorus couchianus TaxID=32473 RepID=UPI001016F334|nr:apoptosis-stimulating of p53 protein 2-like isoform X2 [Xiphophorus couchianus]